VTNENNNFILGVCTRNQGSSCFVEAKAQSIDGTINDISSSSHKMFGNNGEFEVKSARSIKVGDWVMARPVLEGPPKRQRHVAPTGRRMLPFEDLSGLYAPEAARRLLVETGRRDGFVGDKIFRINLSDVVEVRMAVSDGFSKIRQPENLTELEVWSFLAGKHIRVPTPSGSVDLFLKDANSTPSGFVNWCSDVEFMRQVIASFAQGDVQDEVLKTAAQFLRDHAVALESRVSKTEWLDPRIAQEIMRSRKLSDLLKSQDDMLRDFMAVLRSDPDIKATLAERTEQLAAEAAGARIESIIEQKTVSLKNDLDERMARGRTEIDETLRDLEATELAAMTSRVKAAEEVSLNEITARKMDLEAEVDLLTERLAEVSAQSTAEAEHLAEATGRLLDVERQVADRKEEIDRLIRMELLVLDRKSSPVPAVEKARVPRFPEAPVAARPITFLEVRAWVAACEPLSPAGKAKILRALASITAGGMPILVGDRTDDFVSILAAVIGGGRYVTFDCDPTVISFDDLWVRPGSRSPTALGEALADCDKEGIVRFCVIRNIQRSAAHFWVETLADKLRRHEIPDNMLICLTMAGAADAALEESIKRAPVVDTTGSMHKGAVITFLSKRGDEAVERQLDLASLVAAPKNETIAAALKLMNSDVWIGASNADWFERFVAAAMALIKPEEVDEFLMSEAAKKSQSGGPAPGKPELRVIENGGGSNA
jgi:hypothetical protein